MTSTVAELATKLSCWLDKQTLDPEPGFYWHRLHEHFGTDPAKLPVLKVTFGLYQHPCVHKAIVHYLATGSRSYELLGVGTDRYSQSIPELLDIRKKVTSFAGGPVQYQHIQLANAQTVSCVEQGLYLIKSNDHNLAVNMVRDDRYTHSVVLEIIALEQKQSEDFLTELKKLIEQYNVYKGHVLSLKNDASNFEVDPDLWARLVAFRERVLSHKRY